MLPKAPKGEDIRNKRWQNEATYETVPAQRKMYCNSGAALECFANVFLTVKWKYIFESMF